MDDINPETNKFTEAVIQWGKGSGKDLITAILFCRHVYHLLCFRSPTDHLQCMSFNFLNVASNAPQAKEVFFKTYMKELVVKAGKSAFLNFGFNPLPPKNGGGMYDAKIMFPKSITLYSGNSEQEGLEGKNLYMAVLDEASAFKSDSELAKNKERPKKSASAIYNVLKSSIRSRHPKIGKMIIISYPRFKNDFTQQKYNEGLNLEHVYTSFGSTYEINQKITRESLQTDYDVDEEKAMSMYDCIPPASVNPFLGQHNLSKLLTILQSPSIIDPFDETGNLVRDFLPTPGATYVVGVDTALRKDSAAVAMGTISSFTKNQPFLSIPLMKVYNPPKDGSDIDLSQIRQLIYDLTERGFKIIAVLYDQFQSADSIQILTRKGYKAEIYSVDRNMEGYLALKSFISEDRFDCYYNPVFFKEAEGLTLINGKKVDHPDPGSKDLTDCIARIAGKLISAKNYETRISSSKSYDNYNKNNNRRRSYNQVSPLSRAPARNIRRVR